MGGSGAAGQEVVDGDLFSFCWEAVGVGYVYFLDWIFTEAFG